jgi:hypothetical protein
MNEKEPLALEILKELKANSKRNFIAFVVVLILWFATIGVFIWYINQPIDTVEDISYTQDANTEGDNSNIDQNIGE